MLPIAGGSAESKTWRSRLVESRTMRIAVVGTGISGMLAANLLSSEHEVHVFESASRIGGHTHALEVEVDGSRHVVDIGFMVFNRKTYPNFCRMLELLGVDSRESDMSFSVRDRASGIEWEGSSLRGLLAQPLNALRPGFWRMLWDVARFNGEAPRWLAESPDESTLGEWLARRRYSREFVDWYLTPMTAAIWSAEPQAVAEFPARFLIRFFVHHGLLRITGRPIWRTIVGSSQAYVDKLTAPYRDNVRRSSPVERIQRFDDHVVVRAKGGHDEAFDQVVIATHSDQALAMLTDPSAAEREILSAIPYQKNTVVVHVDERALPRARAAWASWNGVAGDPERPVAVTYDLSRLQGLRSTRPILATLNDPDAASPDKVLAKFEMSHPVFTVAGAKAQSRHGEINGTRRTHYCGAYWFNGFHEDGVRSALAVAKNFGLTLEACAAGSSREPSDIAAFAR